MTHLGQQTDSSSSSIVLTPAENIGELAQVLCAGAVVDAASTHTRPGKGPHLPRDVAALN